MKLKKSKLELKQGTILFISDNAEFQANQVIGEISSRGNLITEKVTKDLPTDISGEVYFSDLSVEEKIDRQGNITLTTSQGGLIWILAGDVYNVPMNAEICVKSNDLVRAGEVLATTEIISDYGGTVRLSDSIPDEIQIITASTFIENSFIRTDNEATNPESSYFLELENGKKFVMHCSPGNKLTNSQTIAELMDNSYLTSTGGFIKYSNPEGCKITKHKRGYEVVEDLTLYWIPEETHEVNKDASLLMVSDGELVSENQELIKDLFSLNSGIVSINEENGIVKEITIKPGYIHKIAETQTFTLEPKIFDTNEEVYKGFKASSLSFIELIEKSLLNFF